jgi:hypothetical protein
MLLATCSPRVVVVAQQVEAKPASYAANNLQETTHHPHYGSHYSHTGQETHPGEESYPHILSTDVWDPNSFWYTERNNIVGTDVEEEWDPLDLINTDRPDFTDVAAVVPKGKLQVESGYGYNLRSDRETRVITQFLPNSLWRYGLTEKFELRCKWKGYESATVQDMTSGDAFLETGNSDLELGFKYVIKDQDDWNPMHTVVTRLMTPLGSSNFSANAIEPGITYIYNWQVRKWWFIRGASGVDWLHEPEAGVRFGGGGIPLGIDVGRQSWVEGHQTVSSYMQISKKVGVFSEWFMFYRSGASDNRPDHFHNYGLYFYHTPNSQFDFRIGSRIGPRIDQYFLAAGYSFRL